MSTVVESGSMVRWKGGTADAAAVRRGVPAPGFTLVEMLVALVVAGVLAGGVMSLLLRQNSFYGQNDDAIYAEQTVRGTAELVASELRMASPSDILYAGSDSIAVRFDAMRAVVCGNNGSTVYAYAYDIPSGVNLPSGRGTAFSAPSESGFHYYDFDGTGTPATSTTAAAYTTCVSANDSTAQSADLSRYRSISWGAGTMPADGSVLRVYGTLAYSFGSSSFTSGTALRRNGQELVAPFASGAAFKYVMQNGSVNNSVSSGSYANVRRIRISASAIGSGSNRYDVSRDLSFDIPIRNVP